MLFATYFRSAFLLLFSAVTLGKGTPQGGIDHELLDTDAFPVAPVVMANGQMEDASGDETNTPIYLSKGNRFEDGYLRVLRSSVLTMLEKVETPYTASRYVPVRAEKTSVSLVVKPSEDYENVLVAALFHANEGGSELRVHAAGDLKRDQKSTITFIVPAAYDTESQQVNYAFLFFTDTGEIVTPERREITPLVNRCFTDFYSKLSETYVSRRFLEDLPPRLVQKYPVELALSRNGAAEGARGAAYFTLEIDERGLVSSVRADSELDERSLEACERSLKEWLFMPRIEAGFAVRSKARVPVLFD